MSADIRVLCDRMLDWHDLLTNHTITLQYSQTTGHKELILINDNDGLEPNTLEYNLNYTDTIDRKTIV